MRKILITGGPVHAYLDAVKLVTNRFKGGLMARLAEDFANAFDCDVTYLCAKGSTPPAPHPRVTVVHHDGFEEYRRFAKELATVHTDVILGAAVANLVPANPWKGKFPSHNYRPGDIVNVPFQVAPRIIDEIKEAAPHVNLFGFKLLSGVSREELVAAAYGIVQEARALAVIANDAKNLGEKLVVTKERGVHPVGLEDLASYLWSLMTDTYYRTESLPAADFGAEEAVFRSTVAHYLNGMPELFVEVEGGYLFGTVATRAQKGFWTTLRGKTELSGATLVESVNHETLTVTTRGPKATLNAPLLDIIFSTNPSAQTIVHAHQMAPEVPTLRYAPPGTVRDSQRALPSGSFNIEEHGCFVLFDAAGNLLKSTALPSTSE